MSGVSQPYPPNMSRANEPHFTVEIAFVLGFELYACAAQMLWGLVDLAFRAWRRVR